MILTTYQSKKLDYQVQKIRLHYNYMKSLTYTENHIITITRYMEQRKCKINLTYYNCVGVGMWS